jgi:CheY-like chemotaxis protein
MDPNESLRVLIVEDESLLAMMVEDVLTDAGWTIVASVASVPEALDAVRRGGFDVALLDVNLAGQEVFPVADAVLARGLPLVFATGYGLNGIREDLRHLPVIAKPFSPGQLLHSLRMVVGGHAGAAQESVPA